MKAAIYIRVSSSEQAEEGYSIAAQEEKLTAYCVAKSWSVYKTYIDPGYSGANINRPAMKQLINDIKLHRCDIVVVYKLDRLTRSQKDCITMLEDILLPNNCDFVSISENFDTSTPYGRAMIGILSVFAQLERETITERTVMGRIERAKTGLYAGNSHIPIGYNYVDGKLEINEYEAMQVREIFELYNNGTSICSILKVFQEKGYATKYGNWVHLNTIKRILASKLYHGELKYKGEYYEGQHKAIISKETFDKAQEVHKHYSETATGHRKTPFVSKHLLTGLIMCGECGARMHAKTISRKSEACYICYSVSRTSKKYIVDENCKSTTWPCWELEGYVLESLQELDFKKIKELQNESIAFNDNEEKIKILHQEIDALNKKSEKLLDLYLLDTFSKDTLSDKLKDLEFKKEALEKEIDTLSTIEKKESASSITKKIKKLNVLFEKGTLEEKKAFLNSLIDSIVVYKDNIVIKWTFV